MALNCIFYSQVYAAEHWSLLDAVYWLGAQLLPKQRTENAVGVSPDSFELILEDLLEPDDDFENRLLELEATERMGLPADPRCTSSGDEEHIMLDPRFFSRLTRMLYGEDVPPTDAERIKRAEFAEKCLKYDSSVASWKTVRDDYLDQYVSEVIVDLRRGHLQAEGIRVEGRPDGSENKAIYDAFCRKVPDWGSFDSSFEPIPKELWVRRRVNLSANYVEAESEVFLGVRVDGEGALRKYPPKAFRQRPIQDYGDGLFLTVDEKVRKSATRRGRPPKQWDAVSMRIAERISENGCLPRKQDAFAQELVDWYQEKFNQNIGLSTVKARLTSYYNNPNFKKSEK